MRTLRWLNIAVVMLVSPHVSDGSEESTGPKGINSIATGLTGGVPQSAKLKAVGPAYLAMTRMK
jgi:hypothetical protein